MRRVGLVSILAMLQACVSIQDESKAPPSFSADAYATCAACHLADGAGIPGAFPPTRDRVAAIAALTGGRDYLITVVSYGLMGEIKAGNMQYFGVMPGNKGPLSADDIAAALNYTIFELADDKNKVAGIEPITAEEVTAVQSITPAAGPAAAAGLRKELVARHTDEWPE